MNRQCWIGLPLNLPLGREISMWQLTHSTGIMTVGEQDYYASELLFAVDHVAYRDLGGKLMDDSTDEAVDEVES